jgi:Spx/MgsR family transcriptional regulator
MLKLFGLRKCTTCQKAMDYLDKKKKAYDFTDVKEDAPTKEQVTKWSRAVGGWEKLINRAGYTWRGLSAADTETLTEAKAVTLAVKNPSLIRRPLIEHPDGSVTVGFSDKVKGFIG